MKKLFALLLLSAATLASAADAKPIEPKRVCVMVYDAKIKQEVGKCRMLKVRHKHHGKAVPESR